MTCDSYVPNALVLLLVVAIGATFGPDLLVSTEEIPGDRFFKQGSGWSKTGTMRLREFCGSQFCFVVLFHALESICNGHPASVVVDNQEVTKSKTLQKWLFHSDRYLITRRS